MNPVMMNLKFPKQMKILKLKWKDEKEEESNLKLYFLQKIYNNKNYIIYKNYY